MHKKKNIIQINGLSYDARSGAILDDLELPSATNRSVRPVVRQYTARDLRKRQPEPSRTLMRTAVRKPRGHSVRPKAGVKSVVPINHHPIIIDTKSSTPQLDPKRIQHAQRIKKSTLVSRFGPSKVTFPEVTVPHIAAHPDTVKHHVVKSKHPETTADLLQHALAHPRQHHKAQPHKKRRFKLSRKSSSVSSLVIAVLVLAGFASWQNIDNFRVHAASNKAGFAANLPTYQPSGYRLNQMNSHPGEVALHFTSNSDKRAFSLTEKSSAWDNQTLRETFVAEKGNDYRTIESAGKTLYLYGEHNATWLDGGVWYQLQNDSALSDHQVIELASSM